MSMCYIQIIKYDHNKKQIYFNNDMHETLDSSIQVFFLIGLMVFGWNKIKSSTQHDISISTHPQILRGDKRNWYIAPLE